MQVNVLGAERWRRWSYDEKVRLVEETLQPGETGLRGGTPARGGS
jgi:transposase